MQKQLETQELIEIFQEIYGNITKLVDYDFITNCCKLRGSVKNLYPSFYSNTIEFEDELGTTISVTADKIVKIIQSKTENSDEYNIQLDDGAITFLVSTFN